MSAFGLHEKLATKNAPKWEEARRNQMMRPALEPMPAPEPQMGDKRLTLEDVVWLAPISRKRTILMFSLTKDAGRVSTALHREIGQGAFVEVGMMGDDTIVIVRVPERRSPKTVRIAVGGGQIGNWWLVEALTDRGWTSGRFEAVRAREDIWMVSRKTRTDLQAPRGKTAKADDQP
jgi:hypothetical protein